MKGNDLRTDEWLKQRLEMLIALHYSDVKRGYPIRIKFGSRARYRFGSIYSVNEECHILINKLFASPEVPEYVVDSTLVHEMAHYVHGYGSGLRKMHAQPHRGGVVDEEMRKRGCDHYEVAASEWRRQHWKELYKLQAQDILEKRSEREKQDEAIWDSYLNTPGFHTDEELRSRWECLKQVFGRTGNDTRIEWLYGSLHRNGLSYRYGKEGVVRIHAALANKSVPNYVLDYEMIYWLAEMSCNGWRGIEDAIQTAGLWPTAQKAIEWRKHRWKAFLRKNHPLRKRAEYQS